MALRDEVLRKRDTVLQIAARHGARNVRLFGSVARGEERPDSDIDLLIDLDVERGFSDYLDMAEELEALLHRRVDLLLARSLSPFFRPYIEADARPGPLFAGAPDPGRRDPQFRGDRRGGDAFVRGRRRDSRRTLGQGGRVPSSPDPWLLDH